MGKEQTNLSRYPSKYSPEQFVTGPQYIVETLCENVAIRAKVELPQRFWQLPEWEEFFKNQIPQANKLVKRFAVRDIVAALKSYKGVTVYSLRAPYLLKLIQTEARKSQAQSKQEKIKLITGSETELPRPAFSNKSNILDKLDG